MSQDREETRSMAESLPDADAPTKQSYRSFKKKFAKLKIQFELKMKESESLIREQLRIEDLSKRIQEQNDQLLEVLMEFNDTIHVPSKLRYNLNAPDDQEYLPAPDQPARPPYVNPDQAYPSIRAAKEDLDHGNFSAADYAQLMDQVKRGAFAPHRGYTDLTKYSKSTSLSEDPNVPNPAGDLVLRQNLGYLTPEHETVYCLGTDARLGDMSAALQLSRVPEKPPLWEREREQALRSPVSVHHWLRKNHPNVFLQDNENASEKSGTRPANLRASKRSAPASRKDEDTHDEDSVMADSGPTSGGSKAKRKRDDEGTPRAKGGSGSRSKKKKEDPVSNTKRPAKRPSGGAA